MAKKREKTRESIIDASYTVFAQNGFNRITMKDICEATGLSRGGLYSHFDSTKAIFEALLERMNQKQQMDFFGEMEKGIPATIILENALQLMKDEMNRPEDSLSLAMYEYAGSVDGDMMEHFNQIGEMKWTALVEYGTEHGEVNQVDVKESVNVVLYVYQGVRMWSCVVKMQPETIDSITNHIRKQLIKEEQK